MIEYSHCPVCAKDLPDDLEANFCPYCGVRFEDAEQEEVEPAEPAAEMKAPAMGETAEEPEPGRSGIPWENGNELPFAQRLTQTWSAVLLAPADFFRNIPVSGGVARPLSYGIIFKILGMILSAFWLQEYMESLATDIQELPAALQEIFANASENQMSSPSFFLFAPLQAVFGLFLSAGMLHVSLLLMGGARNGFEATFRVVAYSESVAIFFVLPLPYGWFVFLAFWIYLCVVGLREAHETSTAKASVAVFAPFVILCCFMMFIGMIIASALQM